MFYNNKKKNNKTKQKKLAWAATDHTYLIVRRQRPRHCVLCRACQASPSDPELPELVLPAQFHFPPRQYSPCQRLSRAWLRKGPRESGFCFLFLIYSFSSTGRTQGLNTLQVSSLRRSAALASEDTAPTFTFSRSRWNTVREKVKPAGHEQSVPSTQQHQRATRRALLAPTPTCSRRRE